ALARGIRLVTPRTAIRPRRRLVGHDTTRMTAIRAPTIRPRKETGRHFRHDDTVGAQIAAHVIDQVDLQAEQRPISGQAKLHVIRLLPGMVDRHKVFHAVLNPLYWPLQLHGRKWHEEILGIKLATGAETTAHIRLDEMN